MERLSTPGIIAYLWAVGGVVVLIVYGLVRLIPRALVPIQEGMTTWEAIAYVASVLFIGYTEGYRGFQKQFSPRVAARGLHLATHKMRTVDYVLAPFLVMGHFRATRRRLISAWVLTIAIVGLIASVAFLPPIWRGIVDGGVVVGLSWGTLSLIYFGAFPLLGKKLEIDPEIA